MKAVHGLTNKMCNEGLQKVRTETKTVYTSHLIIGRLVFHFHFFFFYLFLSYDDEDVFNYKVLIKVFSDADYKDMQVKCINYRVTFKMYLERFLDQKTL